MSRTAYEYRFFEHLGTEEKFIAELNSIAEDGWHIIHFTIDRQKRSVLLERIKPS
jgi:hypothetical protein